MDQLSKKGWQPVWPRYGWWFLWSLRSPNKQPVLTLIQATMWYHVILYACNAFHLCDMWQFWSFPHLDLELESEDGRWFVRVRPCFRWWRCQPAREWWSSEQWALCNCNLRNYSQGHGFSFNVSCGSPCHLKNEIGADGAGDELQCQKLRPPAPTQQFPPLKRHNQQIQNRLENLDQDILFSWVEKIVVDLGCCAFQFFWHRVENVDLYIACDFVNWIMLNRAFADAKGHLFKDSASQDLWQERLISD